MPSRVPLRCLPPLAAVLVCLGCGPPPVGVAPRLSGALTSNCHGFPDVPFSPDNKTSWMAAVWSGDLAIDFELRDLEGASRTLSGYLADKPVWLQLGSYTCDIYQAANDVLSPLVTGESARGPWTEQVHFVHVYVIEPHPKSPDPSPYRGEVWERAYSTMPNPTTYEGRVANARQMRPLLPGAQHLLVDDLAPGRNNPVWCTYGTCPACSFLIGRDGRVLEVLERTPADGAALLGALERLAR